MAGPTASELLEKGIYQEETKGDLDVAITIYQQLLGEAKNAQSLAAQAQFRLGQCYLKKNRPADATVAFERLVRDYPGEKDLVAKAREHLPADLALQPVPWVDGERLQLDLTLASGLDVGSMEYRALLGESNGRKVWNVGVRMHVMTPSISTVVADATTFAPLTSTWKHGLLGEASATFRPTEIEINRLGKEPAKITAEKTVYDNEQCVHLLRRLPLEVGYKTTVPIIASLGGAAVIPLGVEVTAKETTRVPAGEFECFKVALSNAQTFWFSTDAHRYLVQFEAGGAMAKLVSIAQRGGDEPVVFRDDAAGISLTTPPNWVLHMQIREKQIRTLHLMDPLAEAEALDLTLFPTDSLTSKARTNPRVWGESYFAEHMGKELKDAKLRADSWRPVSVNGRAGMSVIGDFTQKDQPMVLYSIYALGAKTSEHFVLACAADKFEALRPTFERIVATYRSK
jgi:hypothetical protein